MSKFTADYKDRLPREIGEVIITTGNRLGQSRPEKDSYWSCLEKDGEFYISLNDEFDDVWEADLEDINNYVDQ